MHWRQLTNSEWGRILGLLAIVLAASSYRAYDRHWLSADERKAGYRLLYSLDSLNEGTLTDLAFADREARTGSLLAAAHTSAHTNRDELVVMSLESYRLEIHNRRSDTHLAKALRAVEDAGMPPLGDSAYMLRFDDQLIAKNRRYLEGTLAQRWE